MSEPAYVPIACGAHDRLESLAVQNAPVAVVWRDETGDARHVTATITDVFARDAADWITLSTGETVRADRLVAVDGVPVATT